MRYTITIHLSKLDKNVKNKKIFSIYFIIFEYFMALFLQYTASTVLTQGQLVARDLSEQSTTRTIPCIIVLSLETQSYVIQLLQCTIS